ncbi:efflux RND transporter periplasmic adaptor subunit [Lichenicoccus sp.]|uniref:efflux RND transporter periplasmic adaptor subunit n=1 Tax=Lichenicoccus sp. TaxID=2781899 RepID=UPI003D0CBAFC
MTRQRVVFLGSVAAIGLLAGIGGFFVGHAGVEKPTVVASSGARKPLYWVGPMDPSFRSDKPGKSPMGMDLIPVYADADKSAAASNVHVSPDVIDDLGVRTATVKQGLLAHRIEAVGYVGYDEDLVSSINTRADGWIEKLFVKAEGDTIKQGQPLYEMFSPKLATAESEYLTAMSSGMPSLLSGSRARLRALGFGPSQIEALAKGRKAGDRVARYADTSGVLIKLGVREGAYVMPATEVMKIADLSKVWVLVEVDQSRVATLDVGQKATATIDAFPGQSWNGVIDYIYPDINATTRTVKVRVRFDNPDRRLRPNMYAHVVIDAAPKADAVFIPSSALIETGDSERVAVALGGGRFDICPVVAGFQAGSNTEILKGLEAGQKVVVAAQFLIDSEANVDAAALQFGSEKAACKTRPSTELAATARPGTTRSGPANGKMPGMPGMPGMKDMPAMPPARSAGAGK